MLSTVFHVSIHAGTGQAAATPAARMFACSFEEVVEALGRLPRMFVEPDGSFVWVASEEPGWQIDGVLYDGTARLWYVELKGCCPQAQFDELLSSLGWPQRPVTFQLVQEAATLDEEEFRRHVGWLR
ncbi:MAG TPA: hypothetical protein VG125_07720 [Pirellulales bacterium]|jgi:hypothetical protein|nr:hypothetical protein [Pirellulales bacterium]